MHRFYPDRELPELDPEDIAGQLHPLLEGQLKKLHQRHELAFSLSGGLDTRVTLATSRPVAHKSLYFTYYSKLESLKTDVVVARQLSSRFGLRHVDFSLSVPTSWWAERIKAYHDGILVAAGPLTPPDCSAYVDGA
jgi:asparagine synthetase B (glutamine-hydrolysing)